MTYVNEQAVREFTNTHPKSLVMVGASWCQPCRVIKPKVINMEADYDTVSFAYLDIDDGQTWAKEHNIMAVPTFVLYVDGKIVRAMPTSNEMGIRDLLSLVKKL
jgi:thioredoxin 1